MFTIKVTFHGHWWLTGQQGKEGTIFYSTLPLSTAHEHSDIYFELCMWHNYHIFSIALLTATRWDLPPYPITIWLINDVMLIFPCLLDDLILGFSYSNFPRETGGLEFESSITHELQANRLSVLVTRLSNKINHYHFPYAENWELVKSIVGTKYRSSHVCLHSQAAIGLW